jgi:uncharacterized protein YndB with AHSA1/START domain
MNPDLGPLSDVAYERSGEGWTLVFVRDIPHPPSKVWAALSDQHQVGQWAPFTADRDLGTPGDATLTMIDGDTEVPLAATVTTARPPELLEYTWGEDRLRWELTPTPTGTRLTLRHTLADRDFVSKVAACRCRRSGARLLASTGGTSSTMRTRPSSASSVYPPIEPYERGRLPVGDGHELYWETCGDPAGRSSSSSVAPGTARARRR